MKDYILTPAGYDNSRPLFLGGERHGETHPVGTKDDRTPELAKFDARAQQTGAPEEVVTYQRWTLSASRDFVFYRLLGLSNPATLALLVELAMEGAAGRRSASSSTSKLATGIREAVA